MMVNTTILGKIKHIAFICSSCLFILFNLQNAKAADFTWYRKGNPITYTAPRKLPPVVFTALRMWESDMQAVTGDLPRLQINGFKQKPAIRFMLYNKKTVATLAALGIETEKLKNKKEAFIIQVMGQQLFVVGNDPRGLAYGILELSRLAGVSPWIWWGDVRPEKKSSLTLPEHYHDFQSPSIAYRGIFINDEDWSILPWSALKYQGKAKTITIDAKIYTRIFHLLLRLRANIIWPAMHGNTTPFYWTPGARQSADSCGIIIGTSHCEPLLCNANGEWQDSTRGDYNYITNKKGVLAYWAERLKVAGKSENFYTIGMRGKHDGPMQGVHTLQEKTKALQAVIDDQRELLAKYVNKDLTKVPQQFVPYKEVLDIYENGLIVPDDVMLTWCDDNYGYIKRLSDSIQQKRSGGSGVYYHLSYWGRPHDYLWLTTTQPGLMYNQMQNAYHHNARRLWIVNVHDPKVSCYDLELFLDMAWDIDLKKSHANVETHLKNCLTRDYGARSALRLLPVMRQFYHLSAIRKPEFMGWEQVELDKKKYSNGISPVTQTAFSFKAFGDEADRYLSAYKKIKQTILTLEKTLPDDKKAAFFAGIKYPVFGAANMAIKWLEAQRAHLLEREIKDPGKKSDPTIALKLRDSLRAACANSLHAYFEIRHMTDYYNNELSGGKWRRLISDHPRNLPVFKAPELPLQLSADEVRKYYRDNLQQTAYDYPVPDDSSYTARNAFSFDFATFKATAAPMLGHSDGAVAIPKGQSLRFNFASRMQGTAVLRTAVIPTQPSDNGDIRYSVQIDQEPPRIISFKQTGRTDQWKLNVLRGQAVEVTPSRLTRGIHTLTVTALDDQIILDQWMVDFKPERSFYMFPVQGTD